MRSRIVINAGVFAALALLNSSQVLALPSLEAWQPPVEIPVGGDPAAPDTPLFLHGMMDVGPNVFIPTLTSGQPCADVLVVPLDDFSPSAINNIEFQTLNREDAGLSCDNLDGFVHEFGSSMARLGDRVAIGSPGLARLDGSGNPILSGEVFIYQPDDKSQGITADTQWELDAVLQGSDFDRAGFGGNVFSDGERIFVDDIQFLPIDTSQSPFRRRARFTGVLVLEESANGQWQIHSRVPFAVPEPSRQDIRTGYYLAGDQVIVYSAGDRDGDTYLSVFMESEDGNGDWQEVQRITPENNLAPELLSSVLEPAQISGDRMMMQVFRNLRDDDAAFVFFRRAPDGRWFYEQNVSVRGTEADFDTEIGSVFPPLFSPFVHNASFNGADLVVAWLQTVNRYRLFHYRLDRLAGEHQFRPLQELQHNSRDVPDIVIRDRQVVVTAGQPLNVYRRDSLTNFLVERGMTGGWWFGPQRSGQGVGLEILPNNRAQLVWLSHDENGEQQWLFAGGDVQLDTITFNNVLRPRGGEFGGDFDPSTVRREPWGRVQLVFTSCEAGELRYDSPIMGTGSLPLFRLTKVDGLDCGDATASTLARRWSGSWFDPTHNGEGVMMHVTPTRNGPRLSSFWTTYHADGRQAMLYTATDIDSLTRANFSSVIRPTGLRFDGSGTLQRNPWGNYSLRSNACGSALLRYNSTDSTFGSGQQNLVRFTRPLGIGCF